MTTPIYDLLCDETLVFPHNNEPPTGPIPVVTIGDTHADCH